MPKFSFKKQESLRYRKNYLIDNAFTSLGGSGSSPPKGRLIENLVFLELIRRRQEMNFELFYYKNITEVDFVIYHDHEVNEMIQVALNMDDRKMFNREVKVLISGAEVLNPERLTIITLTDPKEFNINGKTMSDIIFSSMAFRSYIGVSSVTMGKSSSILARAFL